MAKTSLTSNVVEMLPGQAVAYWDKNAFWLHVCRGAVWVTRPGGDDEIYETGQRFWVSTGVVIEALGDYASASHEPPRHLAVS